MKIFAALVLTGLIAGFVNGFFGTGGGIVIFAAFLLLGCDMRRSLATANFGILVLSIASFFVYLKLGAVEVGRAEGLLKASLIPAVIGGAFGAFLSGKIAPRVLKRLFSALVVICGIRMVTA